MRLRSPNRVVPVLAALVFTVTLVGSAMPAQSADQKQKPSAAKPSPAGAPQNVVVPPDVRARVVSKLQGASPADVAMSPIPGLYEITMGGVIAYVSADGKYLLSGNVYDLDSQVNLTATRRNTARAKALATVSESNMIVFGPANAKMTVTVFTDIDCGYCRKFHNQIADVNKAGVRVRYMMYPRTGPDTESWSKAEQVWCAADRRDALTRAKRGEALKGKACGDSAITAQYELGADLGVEGTPAVFTQNGDYIGGFLTAPELVQAIREAQTAPVAAP
jgi:thiol:disulfide interchange protein DsbC